MSTKHASAVFSTRLTRRRKDRDFGGKASLLQQLLQILQLTTGYKEGSFMLCCKHVCDPTLRKTRWCQKIKLREFKRRTAEIKEPFGKGKKIKFSQSSAILHTSTCRAQIIHPQAGSLAQRYSGGAYMHQGQLPHIQNQIMPFKERCVPNHL